MAHLEQHELLLLKPHLKKLLTADFCFQRWYVILEVRPQSRKCTLKKFNTQCENCKPKINQCAGRKVSLLL